MLNEPWQELIKPEHKLLDIGCWNGKRLLGLKDKCDVYGVDIDSTKFETADKRIRDKLIQGDIVEGLELDMKFDFVLLRDVLEHIENDYLAIANINKVMKKGGRLIISTPKHIPFLNFYDPAWIRWKFFGGKLHWHYKKEELFELLEEEGFEIEKYHTEGTIGWVFARWVNGFFKYVLRSNKQIKSTWGPGYFNWFLVAKKK